MTRLREKERIDQFVAVLRANGHPDLRVEDRPDERNSGDIDAIAGFFAIEHTSVDGVPEQRGHDGRFAKLIEGLRGELKQHFDFHANITFSYNDLLGLTSQSIPSTRAALVDWLREVLPQLADGRHHFSRTPCLPFALSVTKWGARRPGIFFMRDIPEHRTEVDKLRAHLKRKAKKLKRYKERSENYITVLLVDLNGSVFMDLWELIELLYASFEDASIDGVDEVWCIGTVDSTFAELWKLGKEPTGPFHFDSNGRSVYPRHQPDSTALRAPLPVRP